MDNGPMANSKYVRGSGDQSTETNTGDWSGIGMRPESLESPYSPRIQWNSNSKKGTTVLFRP
jgi:hypothetical protein